VQNIEVAGSNIKDARKPDPSLSLLWEELANSLAITADRITANGVVGGDPPAEFEGLLLLIDH
jgi:hypothetical protein